MAETEYFLYLAHRLDYLSQSQYSEQTALCNRAFATLSGLIKAVKKETSVIAKLIALATSALVLYDIKHLLL